MEKKLLTLLLFLQMYKNNNAQAWLPLGVGANQQVFAITQYNGVLYAAGNFTVIGGVSANRIAYYVNGIWYPVGLGMNSTVTSLEVYNGSLYAAGDFTTAGGIAAKRIAKWDGLAWQAIGSGLSQQVHSLQTYNGKLYIGGEFLTANSQSIKYLASYDGANWSPVGSGVDNEVHVMTLYDSFLCVGGYFNNAGLLVGTRRIAFWDGLVWSSVGGGTSGVAQIVALGSEGAFLYVGGSFSSIGFQSINNLAVWDGTSWISTWFGSGPNSKVEDIACLYGHAYIGGAFTFIGGTNYSYIADFDGSIINPMGTGMNGFVNVIKIINDTIYTGGSFTLADGNIVNYISYWSTASPLPIELANFKAECDERNRCYELTWSTYSEHDNEGFVIERSTDGFRFEYVGMVAGHGTTNTSQVYEYCDVYDHDGNVYYRLKQVDYDGEETLLGTRSLSCEAKKKEGIEIQGSDIVVETETPGEFELRNTLGEMILHKCVSKDCRISFENLMRGNYVAVLKNERSVVSKKFVK